jgi:F420-dependent oxidoreductase-like protein
MRVGLQVSSFTWDGAPETTGATWRRIARDADDAGLASLWVMDHFFQIPVIGPPELDMLEAYTTLAHAAAVTRRIELGTLVTGVTYRHPGILLKTVTTLDVLSGGRAWLGIGAAWSEEEHQGLGVPYPPTRERFRLLEDTLRLARQMFADDDSAFDGEVLHLDRPLNHPRPVRRPPIMVGGGGEKRTLRLVAQYADACNLFDTGLGPDGIPRKLQVLRAHCEDVGRDYDEIGKSVLTRLTLGVSGREAPDGSLEHSVDQAVDRLGRLGDAGIDHVILGMANDTSPAAYALIAEVLRQLDQP